MSGRLTLVGAGPGDPDLITVKGLRALREADVVLYDRLASRDLLCDVPPEALLIDVGKKPKDDQTAKQDWINRLIVEHARNGKHVVRLKGGDSFVFGRGGEEIAAAVAAEIPFQVVPGVTSAIAAPASAGIPVTHRGVANAFGVFTGHEADETADTIPWAAAACIPTALFLMGVERLSGLVSKLLEHGRDPDCPAALVAHGTLPNQVVVRGTLSTIEALGAEITPPAVLIVGEVAGWQP